MNEIDKQIMTFLFDYKNLERVAEVSINSSNGCQIFIEHGQENIFNKKYSDINI